MSVSFISLKQEPSDSSCTTETVDKMLEENAQLIQTIYEYQLKGRITECVEYQKVLHRNIVYLAKLTDLGSNVQVSLPTQGAQIGSVSGDHGTQMHSSGTGGSLGAVSSQGCEQGNFQIQEQNTSDHQSLISLNQALMSAVSPGNFGQVSQNCIGQSSNLMMPQQQLIMSQNQPVLLHHSSAMTSDSYTVTSLHESNQMMVVQPLSHQDEYHSIAAGQQGYTQQFSGDLVEIPQYTQLVPAASTQQIQCMPNQQIQCTSNQQIQGTPNQQIQCTPNQQIQSMPNQQIQSMPNQQIQSMPNQQIQCPSNQQIQSMPNQQIQSMPNQQIQCPFNQQIQGSSNQQIQCTPNQQIQCMSNQQILESPQCYVPYSRQRIMSSEGVSPQQLNMDGAKRETGQTE